MAATALAEEVGGRVVPPTAGGQVGLLLVDGGEVDLVAGAARAMTFGARLQGQPEPEAWPAPAGGAGTGAPPARAPARPSTSAG